MTREDSIFTKTWVTNDGRCLTIAEITDDHLRALRVYLRGELPHACDETVLGDALACWMTDHAAGAHTYDDEMGLDIFRVGWLQIVDAEIAKRSTTAVR